MKRDRIFQFCLCLVLCLAFLLSAAPLFSYAVKESIADEAAKDLRKAMVERKTEVSYTYKSTEWIFSPEAIGKDGTITLPQEEVNALLHSIYDRAIAHTGIGKEGDYLRWHIQECAENFTCRHTQTDYEYTFKFTLAYYTTFLQEKDVTEILQGVLSQLELAGKTDYEKVTAIYDYICANVFYDDIHLGDPDYNLQYTAYAALINGTSVCQGYSNLFYRMALEAGLDARMIIGQSRGGCHAWNIVKLDGVYYNVDSTWDAAAGDHRYFLKTNAHMLEHDPDPEYKQPAFVAAYPMATQDYVAQSPNQQPQTPPSTVPAPQPTVTPEIRPTVTPGIQPTDTPGIQPTDTPGIQPTVTPEIRPTVTPEIQPTDTPGIQPTVTPEIRPTVTPGIQSTTGPKTESDTVPTTSVATDTDTTTGPETNATTEAATNATATIPGTGKPTQQPTDSPTESEEKPTGTWILVIGGVLLLATAALSAAWLVKKRK